jgi:hypothetical protein
MGFSFLIISLTASPHHVVTFSVRFALFSSIYIFLDPGYYWPLETSGFPVGFFPTLREFIIGHEALEDWTRLGSEVERERHGFPSSFRLVWFRSLVTGYGFQLFQETEKAIKQRKRS